MDNDADWGGTSYHGDVVIASYMQLANIFGVPCDGEDGKTHFNWFRYTPKNTPFTIYDWKFGFTPNKQYAYEWHIGAHTPEGSYEAKEFINRLLRKA